MTSFMNFIEALQSDLSVASNENKALVKEMEMLNQMFNAMEKHYVNQALTEYRAQVRLICKFKKQSRGQIL